MKLSIIIVSYNVRYYVEQCLHSVLASIKTAGIEAEIFVVDNDSPDNSAGYLANSFPADRYPAIHILPNARNVGFGRANNQAIRRAKGEYILFLNPDTLVTEHTLQDMITFADAHPDLGGLGVKQLSADGNFARESRRGLPTPWVSFCKMSGLCALFPKSRTFGHYYMGYNDIDKPCQIEVISGACMLCRRSALDQVGYFDQDFFMYGEDIDLSYRLLKGGFHNYYIPTPILHYKGESTKKNSYRYVHTFYEAMLIFYNKHYASSSMVLALPIRIAIYMRAIITLLKNQKDSLMEFLSMGYTKKPDLYLYDPSAPNADTLADIAERNGVDLAEAHEPAPQRPVDAVIFNTSETSYADMLHYIENNPKHDYAIGIFNPRTGVLTACHQTYR